MVFTKPFGVYQYQSQENQIFSLDSIDSYEYNLLQLGSFRILTMMAEGLSTNGSSTYSDTPEATASLTAGSSIPNSRARPKLGRASSVNWYNKSFDQSVLRQEAKPPKPRQMRRQSSVTDFFQTMLTKSKSHIVGIFSGKKEKREKHSDNIDWSGNIGLKTKCSQEPLNVTRSPNEQNPRSFSRNIEECKTSSEQLVGKSNMFDESPSLSSFPRRMEQKTSSDCNLASEKTPPVDRFMTGTPNEEDVMRTLNSPDTSENIPSDFPFNKATLQNKIHASPKSKVFSQTPKECYSPLLLSPTVKSISDTPNTLSLQLQFSAERKHSSSDLELIVLSQRSVSSAPAGRSSLGGTSQNLMVRDAASLFKRALVKSNSDSLATESMDQRPIVKASSDGNCFKKRPPLPLGPTSNFMARITNYLFLGSVEAAYNEPLLCKYNISSLIDMTNMPSANVPLHKKINCPCACVNKIHFRSRLNIGVDDIEWENVEQYFDEINTFINGARKKSGRILIFSYMGQSRAAAATVQHLMVQYHIPYDEAYHIVKSKRPQTKINTGFIKALRRIEKTLGLTDESGDAKRHRQLLQMQRSEEATISKKVLGSKKEEPDLNFPHVVRGAWLEC